MLYRVIVEDENGTIIEVAGSSARLARVAPGMVAEALNEAAAVEQYDSVPQRAVVGSGTFEQPAAAEAPGEPEKPKRTRRTKAQIEADKAAEVAASQQVGTAEPQQQVAAPAPVSPASPVAVGGVVTSGGGAATPAPVTGQGGTYNPFMQSAPSA